ncbi:hypothetical protein [Pseudoxanthomonas mexicana]
MSWFKRIATGLGTVIGAMVETAAIVIDEVKRGYESYKARGGMTGSAAKAERARRSDALKDINEELADIRRRARQGRAGDAERRRWDDLRQQRAQTIQEQDQAKEVDAAEKIIDGAEGINKVVINDGNVHIITANAFADVVNKSCRICGRKMKLQWRRDIDSPSSEDLFWGCTGWYFQGDGRRRCSHTERLDANDRALVVNTTMPEFQTSQDDFSAILGIPDIQKTVVERVDDLVSDLDARKTGVEIATCPVHGEALVLKKKTGAARGLLDMYHLRCPYWLPNDEGCPFIEKLKSGSQLAVLLKSETGTGIL